MEPVAEYIPAKWGMIDVSAVVVISQDADGRWDWNLERVDLCHDGDWDDIMDARYGVAERVFDDIRNQIRGEAEYRMARIKKGYV